MSHSQTNPPKKPTLSVAQENVLLELLSGATITAAAQAAGVDRRTVHRWMAGDRLFLEELCDVRRNRWMQAQTELGSLTSEAVTYLQSIMHDNDAPHYVRLRAASAIIESTRMREW